MKQYITYYECAIEPSIGQFCLFYGDDQHRSLSGAIALDELKEEYGYLPIIDIKHVACKHLGKGYDTLIGNGGFLL